MIYCYDFKEEWTPQMDDLLGYYYETKEDASKRLLDYGYEYDAFSDTYKMEHSVVDIIKLKKYEEEL